ncbi:TROVE domain-containing protein [Chitinophaga sp. sic0106]|uniref:TROVE domain-containing protein n=1 Tax=Chitinophaga sp. sic0106 TaxID=2854785 RepID=UPI001C482C54|nr:TROVE domain-containing protein [Chitinophaga sp. sic0106]MBV7532146.1 TROVE domain-containing protein [Chitinophaga sp. sic0106]
MKFNLKRKQQPAITNHAGAKAYAMTPEMELYSTVVTASLSDQFYEGSAEKLDRIRLLMAKNGPAFIARLAVYAREKMYLRSVPMVLAVELAKQHTGDGLIGKMVSRVVQRADEITELLSYYTLANDRKETKKLHQLSKQVQKGLAVAFNKFDEYQFAKYDRKTAITLRDALFMVHPKAKDEAQQLLFNKIAKQDLAVPYTWETELSAAGQYKYDSPLAKEQAFKAIWEQLIDSGQLGYMAMMRNLRNMLQADISAAHIQKVCDVLSDADAVKRAKQLPFRFLAAYRELPVHGAAGKIGEALEKALQASIHNMKGFDGNTKIVIACDVSGSMQQPVSARSKVLAYDIGLMLGMLLQHKCDNVIAGMFGNTWKIIDMPGKNILSNVKEFYKREGEVGYSTNGHEVLRDLIKRGYKADKLMFFSDLQMWNSNINQTADSFRQAWADYKTQVAPDAKLYLFDLQGYGQAPLNILDNDVYLIAGWSDKVFDVLEALEKGQDALSKIQEVAL